MCAGVTQSGLSCLYLLDFKWRVCCLVSMVLWEPWLGCVTGLWLRLFFFMASGMGWVDSLWREVGFINTHRRAAVTLLGWASGGSSSRTNVRLLSLTMCWLFAGVLACCCQTWHSNRWSLQCSSADRTRLFSPKADTHTPLYAERPQGTHAFIPWSEATRGQNGNLSHM